MHPMFTHMTFTNASFISMHERRPKIIINLHHSSNMHHFMAVIHILTSGKHEHA
jgi:hypothetical protein